MKKKFIPWIIAGLLALMLFSQISNYNKMVALDEETINQWANVESVYQRRADLIPNLVKVVKGYADHEKEVLMGITEARSKVGSITIDPSNITPEELRRFEAAQGQLSSALSRLLAVVERYPDLKANQNFLELQAQLEGTENRISVERMKYNETVKNYNSYIRSFPKNILASMTGFERKTPFQADAGAEKAPEVNFD